MSYERKWKPEELGALAPLPEYCSVCDRDVVWQGAVGRPGLKVCPLCKSRHRNRSVASWINREIHGFKNVLEIGQFASLAPLYRRKGWAYSILDKRGPTPGGSEWPSYCGDICDLPYRSGAFDLVVAIAVLEHIPDDRLAYAQLLRVTSPKGCLIIHVPLLSKSDQTEEYGTARKGEHNHYRAPGPDYIDRLKDPFVTVEWIQSSPARKKLRMREWFYVIRWKC